MNEPRYIQDSLRSEQVSRFTRYHNLPYGEESKRYLHGLRRQQTTLHLRDLGNIFLCIVKQMSIDIKGHVD